MTGHAPDVDDGSGPDSPMQDVIQKPFATQDLLDRISSLIARGTTTT